MKKFFLFIAAVLFNGYMFCQNSYIINNETVELKTAVDGNIDLLWNTIDRQYRYFIRIEDGSISELKNTKGTDKKYQEEYKSVLSKATSEANLSTEDVKLTLPSLKKYIEEYNATVDTNFVVNNERVKIAMRLSAYAGITNQPYVNNPENTIVPYLGTEFEVSEHVYMSKHSLFFRLNHAFDSNEFQYSDTQMEVGYRYRFLNRTKFNVYGNITMATYTFSKRTVTYEDPFNSGTYVSYEEKESGLEAPLSFGLGADYRVGKGFLMFSYNKIIAIFLDNQGNFPLDFTLGYKIKL
ncbi:porin family protein [Mangrovimonas aestuarii]|uniref:hypothetical protein n=1 Tax=Mangrovimonas aestuarii TaxID=3018443 RepID=UPI002377ED89|nr:hypothetical protein [Mangrovimonas aestuarii]